MATPTYLRTAIRAMPRLDRCVEMAPGLMKDCVNRLILQALEAMCSEPAHAALVLQAKNWAKVHAPGTRMPKLAEVARTFQNMIRLNKLPNNPESWPMILVDMSMEDTVLGANYSPRDFSNFSLSQVRIALNGKRVYLYFEDYQNRRYEVYARWIQLFETCCHEFAHVFTDYLTTTICSPTRCSTPPLTDRYSTAIESEYDAGNCFESFIFSGRAQRFNDFTGWDWSSMPGVPVLEDTVGVPHGIPLRQVLNLARKTRYEDEDLDDFLPYPLYQNPSRWHDEWMEIFKVPFGFRYPRVQIQTASKDFSEFMKNKELDWDRSRTGAPPNCCKMLARI